MPEMNNMKVGNDVYEVADPKSRGVSLTWAQYQALSYEEQHNGTAYYITDRDAIYPVDHELNANSGNAVANDVVTTHILAMENVLGAKNFIGLIGTRTIDVPFPYTITDRGLTFVFNVDGTVAVSGVADSTGDCEAYLLAKGLPAGEYDITCPSNDLHDNKFYGLDNVEYAKVTDNNSHRVTISSTRNLAIIFYVEEGADLTTPVTFYPMIRPAGTDPTYVPYAMTNRELTENVERGSVSVTGDGVKTYGGLLNELFALIDINKLSHKSRLRVGNVYISISQITNNHFVFCGLADLNVLGKMYAYNVYMAYSDSIFIEAETSTSQTLFTNHSSTAAPWGQAISLYY